MSTIKIQLYQKATDNTGAETDLQQIIDTIAGNTDGSSNIEKRIIALRKYKEAVQIANDKLQDDKEDKVFWQEQLTQRTTAYEDLKKGLPAVTWSGTFTKRAAKHLQQYSGLICIDIDKLSLEDLKALYAKLKNDPHTFVCFVSPSGNGIKVIIKVTSTAEQHKDCFAALEKYFIDTYQIQIDPSGKDVSRLCFLSYSKKLFHNADSTAFAMPAVEKTITDADKTKLAKTTTKETKQLQESGQTINDIFDSTQQVIAYSEGSRNNFLFKFGCNCNRVGISEMECLLFAQGFATDKPATEIKTTIASAYKQTANEAVKYKRKATTTTEKNTSNTAVAAKNRQQPAAANGTTADYIFWKLIIIKRGKGADAYETERYEVVRRELLLFLFAHGFHQLRTSETSSKQLVHSKMNVIKPVDNDEVKQYVLAWVQQRALDDVEELVLKTQTKIFSPAELTSLKYKEVTFAKDTAEKSYFYFQNCYVIVDNEGNVTPHDYGTLSTCIWESSKIKADYKPVQIEATDENNFLVDQKKINCEFARFIALVSYNPNCEEEKHFSRQQVTDRFLCFCSAIGFLLSGYKHPSIRKGIFAIDHKISERGEAHGRTGKSLIPQACNLLKKVVQIDGTSYDPKYQFRDEVITPDAKIINYNDMPPNFDVRHTFEKITDNYSVNRRNNGYQLFPYEISPFVYLSTNHTPKGEGSSYRARMHCIEFSDYFSDTHNPYTEFGHGFFDSNWDEEEWLRFYNFMLWCVAFYKEAGLIEYPNPNIEARKLVNDVVPEFIDFIEDTELVEKNIRLKKVDILTLFNEKIYSPLYNKKITPHSFTNWLRKVCANKGYKLNPKQNGKHDKSNSVEYITIADENWKDDQTKLL